LLSVLRLNIRFLIYGIQSALNLHMPTNRKKPREAVDISKYVVDLTPKLKSQRKIQTYLLRFFKDKRDFVVNRLQILKYVVCLCQLEMPICPKPFCQQKCTLR
jgi:hypothetical protein